MWRLGLHVQRSDIKAGVVGCSEYPVCLKCAFARTVPRRWMEDLGPTRSSTILSMRQLTCTAAAVGIW